MGGCTNCGSKTGCDDRKGDMLRAVDDALAALYPERRWRPVEGGPVDPALIDDAAGLADELAELLRAATFVRPPGPGQPSAFVYALCVGRSPCAVPVRDGVAPAPEEWWATPAPVRERYLRLALAPRVPFAVVQEVAVEVDVDPEGATVREITQPGVYSAPLLARFQKVVATLPAYGRRHLDLGDLIAPPGYDPGDWPRRYAGTPTAVNYLFFDEPATMTSTQWIPREAR
ncbi:MAG: hypothetical protein R3B06_18780 [Kofleriaceae bacterium]